jgi:hypothetical protein
MKAWDDLEKDPNVSLYWTGDERDPDSHWYMDHGIKIEKFRDGHVDLSNAMIAGDFYKPLTQDQVEVFETKGWLRGCYNVCIDMYMIRLHNVCQIINMNPESRELDERKKNIEKKLARYFDLLDNLVN